MPALLSSASVGIQSQGPPNHLASSSPGPSPRFESLRKKLLSIKKESSHEENQKNQNLPTYSNTVTPVPLKSSSVTPPHMVTVLSKPVKPLNELKRWVLNEISPALHYISLEDLLKLFEKLHASVDGLNEKIRSELDASALSSLCKILKFEQRMLDEDQFWYITRQELVDVLFEDIKNWTEGYDKDNYIREKPIEIAKLKPSEGTSVTGASPFLPKRLTENLPLKKPDISEPSRGPSGLSASADRFNRFNAVMNRLQSIKAKNDIVLPSLDEKEKAIKMPSSPGGNLPGFTGPPPSMQKLNFTALPGNPPSSSENFIKPISAVSFTQSDTSNYSGSIGRKKIELWSDSSYRNRMSRLGISLNNAPTISAANILEESQPETEKSKDKLGLNSTEMTGNVSIHNPLGIYGSSPSSPTLLTSSGRSNWTDEDDNDSKLTVEVNSAKIQSRNAINPLSPFKFSPSIAASMTPRSRDYKALLRKMQSLYQEKNNLLKQIYLMEKKNNQTGDVDQQGEKFSQAEQKNDPLYAEIHRLTMEKQGLLEQITSKEVTEMKADVHHMLDLQKMQKGLEAILHQREAWLQQVQHLMDELSLCREREAVFIATVSRQDEQMRLCRREIRLLEAQNVDYVNKILSLQQESSKNFNTIKMPLTPSSLSFAASTSKSSLQNLLQSSIQAYTKPSPTKNRENVNDDSKDDNLPKRQSGMMTLEDLNHEKAVPFRQNPVRPDALDSPSYITSVDPVRSPLLRDFEEREPIEEEKELCFEDMKNENPFLRENIQLLEKKHAMFDVDNGMLDEIRPMFKAKPFNSNRVVPFHSPKDIESKQRSPFTEYDTNNRLHYQPDSLNSIEKFSVNPIPPSKHQFAMEKNPTSKAAAADYSKYHPDYNNVRSGKGSSPLDLRLDNPSDVPEISPKRNKLLSSPTENISLEKISTLGPSSSTVVNSDLTPISSATPTLSRLAPDPYRKSDMNASQSILPKSSSLSFLCFIFLSFWLGFEYYQFVFYYPLEIPM